MADSTHLKEDEDEPQEDYMSDDFLVQCLPKDVRPSLIPIRKEKRKHELMKKQEESNAFNQARWKSARQIEHESREAGLKKEIGSENKGFKMLEKMGYKPGTSIGKASSGSEGLKHPISLEVKGDRMGLGKKTVEKEKLLKVRERREEWQKLSDPDQFRQRMQAEAAQKDIERDLKKAQSACRVLDVKRLLEEPIEPWYWPKPEKLKKLIEDEDDENPRKKKVVEDESEDEDFPEPKEQLEIVTNYLRANYYYCIWCGTDYDNKEELLQSCPGNTKDEH